MNVSKFSRAAAASLLIAGAAIATPASASGHNNIVRDLLLAPLVLPAAIIAATVPHVTVQSAPVYYDAGPRYQPAHRAPPPPPRRAPRQGHGRGW
ncbi:MAG: hypothetical protein LBR05_01540 [Azoarcus sp.]|nr:hypothetical protein [Azoarcus sp.]